MLRKFFLNTSFLFNKLPTSLSCFVECCLTKNKLVSDHFWAVSLKALGLQENADYLKSLFIFSNKDLFIFLHNVKEMFS